MVEPLDALQHHLSEVRTRIRQACQRSGRDPASIRVVCVTKGVPIETIRQAVALGIADLGENRVQEARAKQTSLGFRLRASGHSVQPAACSLQSVRWHMIGHLQRNKAKDAVGLFEVIHSLDSVALAKELERHAEKQASGFRLQATSSTPQVSSETNLQPLEVFIQVNVSGESNKFGCTPDEAIGFARVVTQLPHLYLSGLMTMAPFTDDPEQVRPHFRRLRELRNTLTAACSLPAPASAQGGPGQSAAWSLSMGMSHDFEVAIEEGADVVRIGSAIFKNAGPGA